MDAYCNCPIVDFHDGLRLFIVVAGVVPGAELSLPPWFGPHLRTNLEVHHGRSNFQRLLLRSAWRIEDGWGRGWHPRVAVDITTLWERRRGR
jgi:hypothetical protein